MRLAGQSIMGYYPTPDLVIDIVCSRVSFPKDKPFAAWIPAVEKEQHLNF